MPLLIVNADDFGLTRGISSGIIRAHREGIVTSTSVIAIGPAFDESLSLLEDNPRLAVGVHLAAVGEDPPLLTATEIPTLLDRRGRLHETWRPFLRRAMAGRIDPDDLRREFAAQLELASSSGLSITHLDAHQHLHLWPSVRSVVLDLAAERGVPAVRVPRLRAVTATGLGVSMLARELARHLTAAGYAHTDEAVGIEMAGRLDLACLLSVLATMGQRRPASVELTVHPGEATDPDRDRYRWGYRWPDELAALIAPEARRAVADHGLALGTYADLAPRLNA